MTEPNVNEFVPPWWRRRPGGVNRGAESGLESYYVPRGGLSICCQRRMRSTLLVSFFRFVAGPEVAARERVVSVVRPARSAWARTRRSACWLNEPPRRTSDDVVFGPSRGSYAQNLTASSCDLCRAADHERHGQPFPGVRSCVNAFTTTPTPA
jgi:hypothetical protein